MSHFSWIGPGAQRLSLKPPFEVLPTDEQLFQCLSRIKRWGGWFEHAISVAQHSVLVMLLLDNAPLLDSAPDREFSDLKLAALYHDAHEALYGDRVAPVHRLEREMLNQSRHPHDMLCDEFDRALEKDRGLSLRLLAAYEVRWADQVSAAIEARHLGIDQDEIRKHFGEARMIAAHELDHLWNVAANHAAPTWLDHVRAEQKGVIAK